MKPLRFQLRFGRDKRMREWVEQLKHASGLAFTNPESINAAGISSAPYKYQMILCCDPLMYPLLDIVMVDWKSLGKIF